jgi:hypothetical protein
LNVSQEFIELLRRNGVKKYQEKVEDAEYSIEFFSPHEMLQSPPQPVEEPSQMPIPQGETMPSDDEMLFYSSGIDDKEPKEGV